MRKVLIAEANPAMRRVLELAFGREGVQVVSTADGAHAIDLLPVERPDAVLVDRTLPGRGGIDVAAFIRSRPDMRHVPVVVMLGAFESIDRVEAGRAGVADVITKPVDLRRLVSRLRALADRPLPADTDAYLDGLSAALRDRERRPIGAPAAAASPGDGDADAAVPTLASILGDADARPAQESVRLPAHARPPGEESSTDLHGERKAER